MYPTILPFHDRAEAGTYLARQLLGHANSRDVVVLGLPRGGVPVAYEIARALNAPLDTFEVRKLGVPGHEEFAMGAIGSGGAWYLDQTTIQMLGISEEKIAAVVDRELRELERRAKLYRDSRPRPKLTGKTVILVDDGIATGSSMYAAIAALRRQTPARIVVAVPVASLQAYEALLREVDEFVCSATPEPFNAVGAYYENFGQVGDDEVRALLDRAAKRSLAG
jgi:putative phosphoribosyl transferase